MSDAPKPEPEEGRADADWPPFVLAVAPNGARRTKADHPALPMTCEEIVACARDCLEAGAVMLHLHVRDPEGTHSLDLGLYEEAILRLREELGSALVIQATTEAVGRYQPQEQMALVEALAPESASLALREIVPDRESEAAAAEFLAELRSRRVRPQFILYTPDEVRRLDDLIARGVIPGERQAVLFVLGRYTEGQQSHPRDLLPFVAANQAEHSWMVCAFGPLETAAAATAAALGGHARVGFENNLHLPDGRRADDNAALVAATAATARAIGRPLADAAAARQILAWQP